VEFHRPLATIPHGPSMDLTWPKYRRAPDTENTEQVPPSCTRDFRIEGPDKTTRDSKLEELRPMLAGGQAARDVSTCRG